VPPVVLADRALPAVGPTAAMNRESRLVREGPRAVIGTNANEVNQRRSHRKLPWALDAGIADLTVVNDGERVGPLHDVMDDLPYERSSAYSSRILL
jgi:hypothetical protein